MPLAGNTRTLIYIGTYTNMELEARGKAEGIHICEFDAGTGALVLVRTIPGVPNPSFLALAPDGRTLYAVNELGEIDGHAGGAVSAFAVDSATGELTFLNRQASEGSDPCHISVDASGRAVLVANYSSGNVALLQVADDGSLHPAVDKWQHVGSGPDPERQAGPHAHFIAPDPTNRFALSNDLGIDQVLVYRLNPEFAVLLPNDPPAASMPAGAGPRHLAFHPSAPFVYVINELASTMTTCRWDEMDGILEPIQTVSTLPDDFVSTSSCADVHVAPSGRFVYGSNRGHDSIVVFAVDPADGTLTAIDYTPTGGRNPRSFAIDPTGRFLLVANQDTDTIVTFRIDPASGLLWETGLVADLPTPICVLFAHS